MKSALIIYRKLIIEKDLKNELKHYLTMQSFLVLNVKEIGSIFIKMMAYKIRVFYINKKV